ncbi:LysE family translocator [Vibrio sp. SS-MA-C1-2]|uniref:LysE family translocator n=1 Tax=Vibrio sp. SS-MA-C1-2 TaxID=2908646 RepID=UPI001F484BCA|nr:LysE family translocator [Vibrio sp. SS-MA-C1-2]UJF18798.1 LysE family translocator [Vibrio sp. SS-MA-C1-2]
MTFTVWLSLLAIAMLGAMSPGPSLAVVVKHTLASGRSHGIATAWSHALGVGLYALLTLLGLAVVLHQFPLVFNTVAYAGAAYLAWLGYQALSSKGGIADKLAAGEPASYKEAMRDGAMISLLNPKLALFFIALFSQYVAIGSELSSRVIIVATPLIVDGLWYTFVAFVLSHSLILDKLKQKAVWIDRISGAILILLAIRVVFVI